MPDRIGRFKILEQLSDGPHASVYRAVDPHTNQPIALKVWKDAAKRDTGPERSGDLRSGASLRHPGIVPIQETGELEGQPFVVMPFCDGESLARWFGHGQPMSVERALDVAADICDALDYAHSFGVVHGGLIPDDVILAPAAPDESAAQLLNFPLGKARRATAENACYLAPEQLIGQRADRRVDIFAVGAILYEMLTSRAAFPGGAGTSSALVLTREPDPASSVRPELDPALDTLLARALAKNPANRYQTIAELRSDLLASRRQRESLSTPAGNQTQEFPRSAGADRPATRAAAPVVVWSRPSALLVGTVAAGAAFAIFGGWWMFRSPNVPIATSTQVSTSITPTTSISPATTSIPAPPPPAGTRAALIDALPWAEVVRIVDSKGEAQTVPTNAYTPLTIVLPYEDYEITLRNGGTKTVRLHVDANVQTPSSRVDFGRISAADYFQRQAW